MGLEVINILRKKNKLTAEQLSKLSNVPLSTLNKILSGATDNPKLETLISISKVLDCSLDDFADNENKFKDDYFELSGFQNEKSELLDKIIKHLDENECKIVSAYIDGLLLNKTK